MCEVCGDPGRPKLCRGLTNTIKDPQKKIGISILQKVVDVSAAAARSPRRRDKKQGAFKGHWHVLLHCARCCIAISTVLFLKNRTRDGAPDYGPSLGCASQGAGKKNW